MGRNQTVAPHSLAAIVAAHLVVTGAHGLAHAKARVFLPDAATLFVLLVIVAAPLVGVALSWIAPPIGWYVTCAALSASFLFGMVNHFMLATPDHLAHVDMRWRMLFGTTAVLLAATEGLGSWLALSLARKGRAPR
jgi:hypothetical protein